MFFLAVSGAHRLEQIAKLGRWYRSRAVGESVKSVRRLVLLLGNLTFLGRPIVSVIFVDQVAIPFDECAGFDKACPLRVDNSKLLVEFIAVKSLTDLLQ